jgi:streptogramin lyase
MPLGDGPLQTGAVFAGHRIEGVAGRGGMGIVYRATHLALDHVVALKVISPQLASDDRFRRRFEEESRIAVSIRHPNVVPIHHAGEEEGLLFVTMDLIDGTDLRGLLRREGRLEPEHAAAIVAEVAAALDAAHQRGLVHRDIKPGNVLIEDAGRGERVFLTDFGLARLVEATTGVTATGAFVGTLDYVAPEQIRGERVDARSDIYALGCVLFELLTGNAPFAARDDKVAKMYAHLQEEPPGLRVLRPELPGELDLALRRALAKDPADRPPSAGDFARAVSAAAFGQATAETERSVATGAAAPEPATAETDAGSAPIVHAPTAEATEAIAAAEPPVRRAPPPVPPKREMRHLLLAALGLVAVGVLAVVLLAGGGDEDGEEGSTTTSEQPAAGTPTVKARVAEARVPVGKLPVNLAHGQEALWVTNRRSGTVSQVDGDPAEQLNEFDAEELPEGIAVGAGSIWVSSAADGTLLRMDPDTGSVSDEFSIGTEGGGVAFGAGAIWAADTGGNTISKVDPQTGSVDSIVVGESPYGIAIGRDSIWVVNRGDDSIVRVNPSNGRVDPPIEVGANPKEIAVAGGAEWVTNVEDGTVSQVLGGMELKVIEVGPNPRGIVAGFGSVWVAVGGGDVVARIDPKRARVAQTIAVGAGPEGISAGPKSVWVANGIDNALTRIDPEP